MEYYCHLTYQWSPSLIIKCEHLLGSHGQCSHSLYEVVKSLEDCNSYLNREGYVATLEDKWPTIKEVF